VALIHGSAHDVCARIDADACARGVAGVVEGAGIVVVAGGSDGSCRVGAGSVDAGAGDVALGERDARDAQTKVHTNADSGEAPVVDRLVIAVVACSPVLLGRVGALSSRAGANSVALRERRARDADAKVCAATHALDALVVGGGGVVVRARAAIWAGLAHKARAPRANSGKVALVCRIAPDAEAWVWGGCWLRRCGCDADADSRDARVPHGTCEHVVARCPVGERRTTKALTKHTGAWAMARVCWAGDVPAWIRPLCVCVCV
jgi:hypothetical protein